MGDSSDFPNEGLLEKGLKIKQIINYHIPFYKSMVWPHLDSGWPISKKRMGKRPETGIQKSSRDWSTFSTRLFKCLLLFSLENKITKTTRGNMVDIYLIIQDLEKT